jgi:DNA-binding XRE family transcriptional regulator
LLQISPKIRRIQVSGMPLMIMNTVKKLREERLMSKAELARLAGVSPITVDRIERGEECRMETKRKILLALGFSLSEKKKVFQD